MPAYSTAVTGGQLGLRGAWSREQRAARLTPAALPPAPLLRQPASRGGCLGSGPCCCRSVGRSHPTATCRLARAAAVAAVHNHSSQHPRPDCLDLIRSSFIADHGDSNPSPSLQGRGMSVAQQWKLNLIARRGLGEVTCLGQGGCVRLDFERGLLHCRVHGGGFGSQLLRLLDSLGFRLRGLAAAHLAHLL